MTTRLRHNTAMMLCRRNVPIRRRQVVPLPITRAPSLEPLTPRLRKPEDAGEVMGFHADFIRGDDDDQDPDQARARPARRPHGSGWHSY